MIRTAIFIVMLMSFMRLNGQAEVSNSDSVSVDSLDQFIIDYLNNNDIGFLWGGEQSQNERIGYVGQEYERIQIHFNSIIQNFDNPSEYLVYGKSKVMNNICEFQGFLLITEVGFKTDSISNSPKHGFLDGEYIFYEDPSCFHSGIFQGKFYTDFYIDNTETLYYDDLGSDGNLFANNSFVGSWYHYDSDLTQVCNWGDYRIAESIGLDIGLEKFKPAFKYLEHGWKEYLREQNDTIEQSIPWWK